MNVFFTKKNNEENKIIAVCSKRNPNEKNGSARKLPIFDRDF